MNYIKYGSLLVLSAFCGFCSAQTGMEIMQKNKEMVGFKTLQSDNTLTITNKNGQKRTRKINKTEALDADDNKSMLVTFTYPADVEGTGLLSLEKTDDRWLYMPSLKQTRRIPSSDLSSSFMGTDFTYEDLESEDISEFNYEYSGLETVDGQKCHHIVATPKTDKKKKESGYSKRELFVTADRYAVLYVRFYDKKGVFFKELKGIDLRKIPNSDKWRFYQMKMTNLKKKSSTSFEVGSYVLDAKLAPDTFTKRSLERN